MKRNCVICGKEITTTGRTTKYCPECKKKKAVEWSMNYKKRKHPETLIGIGSGNHPNNKGKLSTSYKDGIGTYIKYIKDNCEICGSDKNLCVHHKDLDRHNNSESNLITLCRSCHTKEHLKLKTLLRNSKGQFTRAK